MLAKEGSIEIIGEADSGAATIDYITNNPKSIDVILMDINMPEMNGIELAKKVTKINKTIRILALTMHAEDNYIINMINAGALGYILKESGKEELIAAIKTVAEGKQYYSNEVSVAMVNYAMNGNNPSNLNKEISNREIEVLKLIASGKTNKEASEILHVSTRTIETHRRNIMSKLDLNNSIEMVHYAIKHNLIEA